MRPTKRPKKKPYLILPKWLEIKGDPQEEAMFFARAYKKARTPLEEYKVLFGLIENAPTWDIITRTISYYQIFEKEVGKDFPIFWHKSKGWRFFTYMKHTLFKNGGR